MWASAQVGKLSVNYFFTVSLFSLYLVNTANRYSRKPLRENDPVRGWECEGTERQSEIGRGRARDVSGGRIVKTRK